MKGSPVRTTSEPGWKCGSSLKGKIELLHKKEKIKQRSKDKQCVCVGGGDFNEIIILIETKFTCRMKL